MNKPQTAAALMLALAAIPPVRAAPSSVASSSSGIGLGNLGSIDLDASSSSFGQGYVVYRNAHMAAQNGTKLDADTLRANLAPGSNALESIVATGHVRTYLAQPETHRTYTVTSNKAVYNPAIRSIDMTGNVKAVITSAYTAGPLIQTGDSGTIKLGPAPDYPQITMNHVHTTFTPQAAQPSAAPSPPAVPA